MTFLYGIQYETFRRLLEYIYAGVFDVEPPHAVELLQLAYDFELEHLQSLCAIVLQRSLTVENVLSNLILASATNSIELKQTCFKFIIVHRSEVMPLIKSAAGSAPAELLREVKQMLSQHAQHTSVQSSQKK